MKSFQFGTTIVIVLVMLLSAFSVILVDSSIGSGENEPLTGDTEERSNSRTSRAAPPDSAVATLHTQVISTFDETVNLIAAGDFQSGSTGPELITSSWNETTKKSTLDLVTRTGASDWSTSKALETGSKITDMAWGYIDGTLDVNVIVFVTDDSGGDVTLAKAPSSGSTWTSSSLKSIGKELSFIAAGDLVHTISGLEIVTADNENYLYLLSMGAGSTWSSVEIDQVSENVVDMMICDITPTEAGNQLLIIGEGGSLFEFTPMDDKGEIFSSDTIWKESSGLALTSFTVGDADNDGKIEILVGTSDGRLKMLDKGSDGTWSDTNIFIDSGPIRSISVVDIDPLKAGYETVCGGDSKMITALYHQSGTWATRTLFQGDNNIVDLHAGMIDSTNIALTEVIAVDGPGGNIIQAEYSGFYSEILYTGKNKLSGVTIGDIDPDHEGNEAIVAGMDMADKGILGMAWRDGSKWSSETIFNDYGEMLTPAIGDFDDTPGNELAIVGMLQGREGPGRGQTSMLKKSGGSWTDELIVNYHRFLHGAAIGDFLSEHDGNELIVTSFTDTYDKGTKTFGNLSVISKIPDSEGGGWNTSLVWQTGGHVRKAVFADIVPDIEGDELYVVAKTGEATMLYQDETGFHHETIWTDPGTPGLARIAVGDADNDGKIEVLVGGDSMNVGLIEYTGSGWSGKVIFTDVNSIRGVAIGDYNPRNPGNEIAVFGYSARVSMLLPDGKGGWDAQTVFTDKGKGHDLALGDVDPIHDGNELIFSGFSKNLTMVAFYDDFTDPDFSLSSSALSKTGSAGSDAVFDISVGSTGNFNEPIFLELESLPTGLTIYNFESQTLTGSGTVKLALSIASTMAAGKASFTLKATGAGISKTLSFELDVTEKAEEFKIVTVEPANDSHDVKIEDLEIKIEFETEIDADTLTDENIVISTDHGDIFKGSIELGEDKKTVTIKDIHSSEDSHEELPGGSMITVTIKPGVTDLNGDSLNEDYSWEFETAEAEGTHEGGEEKEGLLWSIIIIVIIIIIIAVVGAAVGRKKKPEESEEERTDEEEKGKDKPKRSKK